ncbi:MAG: lipoate--protein ligase [Treponema sp.]|nr:lipoate--protein ligase [Treponema sp.]
MNLYIENSCTDPQFNLALEQYIFDFLDRKHNYFMLWRNNNSVIVGKNQNTLAEINLPFVKSNNINVVRRLSGGGAVYHDLGNINFTFITGADNEKIDFSLFCGFIQKALVSFGIPAEISGRNDITIGDSKISGNAQYVKNRRVMHHGTLLYDCDLDMLSGALTVKEDKFESKGIKSVRSRVANIRPFLKEDIPVEKFSAKLGKYLFNELDMNEYNIFNDDICKIEKLKEEIYSKWSWNYGSSPPYNIRKIRRIEGCGNIEILLDVGKEGIINNIVFFGDFFGSSDPAELADALKGHHFEYGEIKGAIKEMDIPLFFYDICAAGFLSLLFE